MKTFQQSERKNRKEWADQFEKPVREALLDVFFRRATWIEDVEQATDLVRLKVPDHKGGGGVRVRHSGNYNSEFRYEITFRGRVEGLPYLSELEKIRKGYGDWYCYAFGNAAQGEYLARPEDARLLGFSVLDLDAFRAADKLGVLVSRPWVNKEIDRNGVERHQWFDSFDMRYFRRAPRPILLRTSLAIPELTLSLAAPQQAPSPKKPDSEQLRLFPQTRVTK